jgi:hypothetical protein
LNDFLTALFFIAGQSKGISSATSKNLASKGTGLNFHNLLTEAFSVLEDWPNNYFGFLNRRAIHEKAVSRPYQRMKSEFYHKFGSFYSGLCGVLAGTKFDFMRRAFIEFFAHNCISSNLQSFRPRKVSADHLDDRYILKSDLRRLLGVDYRWIDYNIGTGRLKSAVRNKGKKRLILIHFDSLLEISRDAQQKNCVD